MLQKKFKRFKDFTRDRTQIFRNIARESQSATKLSKGPGGNQVPEGFTTLTFQLLASIVSPQRKTDTQFGYLLPLPQENPGSTTGRC